MEFIHNNIVRQVRSFNVYCQKQYYQDFKLENDTTHPIVKILHTCASSLNQIEYSASSNAVEETKAYVKMRVKLSDFTLLPNDITKVLNESNHSKSQRARAYLSNNLESLILELDRQRDIALCDESHDDINTS
jgi:hypothetical protein